MTTAMPWVNVSVSECDEASALGFDARAIGRLTVRMAEFFLFRGCRLVFGHDWREDGIMHAVAQLAESAATTGLRDDDARAPGPRLVNIVPTARESLSRQALDAVAAAQVGRSGVLEVFALHDYLTDRRRVVEADGWERDRACELWVLRDELTKRLLPNPDAEQPEDREPGFRICLGGKTSGYSGFYAGVAEEAYLALAHDVPLYLIGGFGGATADVIEALGGDAGSRPRRPKKSQSLDAPEGLRPPGRLATGGDGESAARRTRAVVAALLGMPLSGLAAPLESFGVERLARTATRTGNGLDVDENATLFRTTDLEEALALIWRGWNETRRGR